jgi:hypothetical protein
MSKSVVERIAKEGGEREAKSKTNADRKLTNAELDGVAGGGMIAPEPVADRELTDAELASVSAAGNAETYRSRA